ncbi:MAG TPA: ribosome-binding factor A [Candidatus Paceibacterota bacterium]|nr:ribosome-binding factor A [Candidatus Paceibacterota bacterium]
MKESDERKSEQIRRLAGEFIQEESSGLSLITVTRVGGDDHLRKATVFVTILPESSEEEALHFLKRKRGEFREHVKKHSRFKSIPFFDFEIDRGEKNRQRIDEISHEE